MSPLVFAHVRAAYPGMPVSEQNCHPFSYSRYMWMHNGVVAGFAQVRGRRGRRESGWGGMGWGSGIRATAASARRSLRALGLGSNGLVALVSRPGAPLGPSAAALCMLKQHWLGAQLVKPYVTLPIFLSFRV